MKATDIQQLADCIDSAKKDAAAFFASDQIDLELTNDAIEIDGIGPVKLPMRPKDVRELVTRANAAPYGKGTKTIVDRSVRDSLEINAACLTFSDRWKAAIEQIAENVARELGLPPDDIKVKPYKLLLYPKGGFFLPHRDSEKHKSMVASLIVMLPSKFGGGELIVEHERQRQRFDFERARSRKACDCAAFYADCLHEVRKVTSGVRVCLSYNLSLKPKRKKETSNRKTDPVAPLITAIKNWTQSRPAQPLVFALEHQYTASGLKPELLKGKDRTMVKQLVAASERANCHLFFGQVERHLVEHAVEGSSEHDGYRRGRYRDRYQQLEITDPSDLEILSVIDEYVGIDGWKSAAGKRVQMASLAVGGDSLVSKTPLEQWKPTSFDYEGYTGNAGNTLARWYHKSAIAIWARADHFRILVQMGMESSITEFLKRQDKLSNRKKSDQELCDQQVEFARAIVEGWPNRLYLFNRTGTERVNCLEKFASTLPQLNNLKLLEEFLQKIAIADWSLPLERLIRTSTIHFETEELFPLLSRYLETVPAPNEYGRTMASGLPQRDAQWLLKLASLKTRADFGIEQLRQLQQQMLQRTSSKVAEFSQERNPRVQSVAEVLPVLMKVAIAMDDEAAFLDCYDLREKAGELLAVRDFDVVVCRDLVAWSDKKFGRRLEALTVWLQRVRKFLQRATEAPPKRPADFTRPAEVSCSCRECQQLAVFLQSADKERGEIKALKARCEHLQRQIAQDQLDASSTIDRATRPFTLRLRKTVGSFKRAKQQYQADLNLLASLPD